MGRKKGPKTPQYSPRRVRQALDAIEGGMPIRKASVQFQIPRSSLQNKLSGKSPVESSGQGGFHSILGKDIEKEIVKWICGFPVTRAGLLTTVEKISGLQKPVGFKNKRPSQKWFYKFLRRHPEVAQKRAEYVNRARGSVTEEKIRRWFKSVEEQLGEDAGVLSFPERVFNMDETAFNLAPKGEQVLGPVGRHVYVESSNSDKENVTTLFTVNAVGTFAPPLTLFKYERMPATACRSAPLNWGLGKTESGWMTGAAFYEYIANVFMKFLIERNIPRPVIVFIDGHSSHLTLHLSKFCRDNGIILVALYPNATHILQPLDVAVFKPLKTRWKVIRRDWRIQHEGREITKFDVPSALNGIITDDNMARNVVSGFRVTGLYPFNPDEVDFTKVIERSNFYERSSTQKIDPNVEDRGGQFMQSFESKIGQSLLEEFKRTRETNRDWTGDVKSFNLYRVWKEMLCDIEGSEPNETHDSPDMADVDMMENEGLRLIENFEEAAEVTEEFEEEHEQTFKIKMNPPLQDILGDALGDVIRWPEKTRKKKMDDTPSVTTSAKWLEYHQKKEDAKIRKEKEKAERKIAREKKAMEKKSMEMKKSKKCTNKQKKNK